MLAYLFGSQASGTTHAESDVDIAVLLHQSLSEEERLAARLNLIGALSQLFRMDLVDVVILSEALTARVKAGTFDKPVSPRS